MENGKFQQESETPWQEVGPGVARQIMGYDDRVMMVKVRFETGAVGTPHSHPHSQVTYVVSGRFEVTTGGRSATLGPGDGFYAAPGETHGVVCLEAGTLTDVFSPCREDFL
ncbi:MAG: cupin domain-containing protein [Rikenellaceae bacterium]|nr:cupin domain-containing protein [Rikenellaceae bacterium]